MTGRTVERGGIKPGAGLGRKNVPNGPPSTTGGPSFANEALAPVFQPGRPNPNLAIDDGVQLMGLKPANGTTGNASGK